MTKERRITIRLTDEEAAQVVKLRDTLQLRTSTEVFRRCLADESLLVKVAKYPALLTVWASLKRGRTSADVGALDRVLFRGVPDAGTELKNARASLDDLDRLTRYILTDLTRCGTNLNQIAHNLNRANRAGQMDAALVAEAVQVLRDLHRDFASVRHDAEAVKGVLRDGRFDEPKRQK